MQMPDEREEILHQLVNPQEARTWSLCADEMAMEW